MGYKQKERQIRIQYERKSKTALRFSRRPNVVPAHQGTEEEDTRDGAIFDETSPAAARETVEDALADTYAKI